MATTTVVSAVGAGTTQMQGRSVAQGLENRRVGLFRVANTGTYAAGGIDFVPSTFGFDYPVGAVWLAERYVAASATRHWKYDYVNKKIIGFVTSTGAEIAGGQDVSTIVFDVLVVGE